MKKGTPCLLFFVIGLNAQAWGDGGMVSPYGSDVWEPEQKGIIVYDQAAHREDLVLQVRFEGDVKDFGWIVPLPSLPEMEEVDDQVFWEASRLTQPIYRRRGNEFNCCSGTHVPMSSLHRAGDGGDIDVYDEQTVGIYHALTVGGDDARVLSDSLSAWGYLHEDNLETIVPALEFYVQKGWVFVAMKIDSSSAFQQSWAGYWMGATDPITFSFTADHIVYPLKISSISFHAENQLLLYVVTSHKMTFSGAQLEYANRLSADEYEDLCREYPALGQLVPRLSFITKLRKNLTLDDMADDLKIEQAPDDHEHREVIYYSEIPISDSLLVVMAAVLLLRPRRKRRRGDT